MKKILSLLIIIGLISQILFNGINVNAEESKALNIIEYNTKFENTQEYKDAIKKYNSKQGIKLLETYDQGTQINSKDSEKANFSPDGKYILYKEGIDKKAWYKKEADNNQNGHRIFGSDDFRAYNIIYTPNGDKMLYNNRYHNPIPLFIKNPNNSSIGDPINNVTSLDPTYSPDGKYIVYTNNKDNNKLYKKNANDNLDGYPITNTSGEESDFSPDGKYIIYYNSSRFKIYRKNANDNSEGIPVTESFSEQGKYSPDGKYIIYYYHIDNKIYLKNANDNSKGTAILVGKYPNYSPDGSYIVYTNTLNGNFLYKISAPKAPNIGSLTNNIISINSINEKNINLTLTGITDPNNGDTITYSYSFDNNNYTNLVNTQTSPIKDGIYSFNIDCSGQTDGKVNIYVKANDGISDSNIVSVTLNKNSKEKIPNPPSEFLTKSVMSDSVGYTWVDNSNTESDNNEENFTIKDENNNIIVYQIPKNTTTITETGLQANTSYQRKICAVNSMGESCSELISFKTPLEVSGGKTTTFSFAGINIDVVETTEMFKVVFSIGSFRINFSIERI